MKNFLGKEFWKYSEHGNYEIFVKYYLEKESLFFYFLLEIYISIELLLDLLNQMTYSCFFPSLIFLNDYFYRFDN